MDDGLSTRIQKLVCIFTVCAVKETNLDTRHSVYGDKYSERPETPMSIAHKPNVTTGIHIPTDDNADLDHSGYVLFTLGID